MKSNLSAQLISFVTFFILTFSIVAQGEIIERPDHLVSEGPAGGPFSPDKIGWQMRCFASDNSFYKTYTIASSVPWITTRITTGDGDNGFDCPASSTDVDKDKMLISINSTANTMPEGTHNAIVALSFTKHFEDGSVEFGNSYNIGVKLTVGLNNGCTREEIFRDSVKVTTDGGPIITAEFRPNCNITHADAARFLGVEHFNWHNIITRKQVYSGIQRKWVGLGDYNCIEEMRILLDNTDDFSYLFESPESICAGAQARNTGSIPGTPHDDPPPSGYNYQASGADYLPWYYDEPLSFVYEDFADKPEGPANVRYSFITGLVGITQEGKEQYLGFRNLFSWQYRGGVGAAGFFFSSPEESISNNVGTVTVLEYYNDISDLPEEIREFIANNNLDNDGDGFLNNYDNCKDIWNADQHDMDVDNIGDKCDADVDGDNVPNAKDLCFGSTLGVITNDDGCTIEQICTDEQNWGNHGEYMSCIAHATNVFAIEGLISPSEKGGYISEAQ